MGCSQMRPYATFSWVQHENFFSSSAPESRFLYLSLPEPEFAHLKMVLSIPACLPLRVLVKQRSLHMADEESLPRTVALQHHIHIATHPKYPDVYSRA